MARITHLNAEFIGDPADFPFVKGNTYPLSVAQSLFGTLIVFPCHGYEWKPIMEYKHAFRDLCAMLHVWKIIEPVHPFEAEKNGFQQVEDPRGPGKPTIIV